MKEIGEYVESCTDWPSTNTWISWAIRNDAPLDVLVFGIYRPESAIALWDARLNLQAFKSMAEMLPHPEEVLADPENAKVPDDPCLLHGMIANLLDAIKLGEDREADYGKLDRFVTYVSRLPVEMTLLAMKLGYAINRHLCGSYKAKEWVKANRDMLSKEGRD